MGEWDFQHLLVHLSEMIKEHHNYIQGNLSKVKENPLFDRCHWKKGLLQVRIGA